MLWIDKVSCVHAGILSLDIGNALSDTLSPLCFLQYRPRTLDDLVINQEFGESLKKLVSIILQYFLYGSVCQHCMV